MLNALQPSPWLLPTAPGIGGAVTPPLKGETEADQGGKDPAQGPQQEDRRHLNHRLPAVYLLCSLHVP